MIDDGQIELSLLQEDRRFENKASALRCPICACIVIVEKRFNTETSRDEFSVHCFQRHCPQPATPFLPDKWQAEQVWRATILLTK